MLEFLARLERLERSIDRWLPDEPINDELPQDLMSYIPALSSQYQPPRHLSGVVQAIESTLYNERRLVLSVPPRHAKTETVLHAFPWLWGKHCDRTHCYVTYEANLARSKSIRVQQLAQEAGYRVYGTQSEWRNGLGGRLLATGIGGPLTGQGIDGLMVIDDPIKNRVEAESPTIRNRVHDWSRDVAFTRLEPGASCIVIQTRWHMDDLAGRLEDDGWPVINIPAVDNDTITGSDTESTRMAHGTPLWQARWPLGALERKRRAVGEHTWASLFQGRPRPREAHMFGAPHYYDELPTSGYRVVHGVDLAYTSRTHADWSVCVTMLVVGAGDKATCYVADVKRMQCEAPQFMAVLEQQQRKYPGPMWWHCSGTEKGSAQFIVKRIPQLRPISTSADKFTRALPVSEAWGAGRVLLPESAPWSRAFLEVVSAFTGVGDPRDDDVDALGSAYAACQSNAGAYKKRSGSGMQRRF